MPRVAVQAAIPIILKYDLLRNEELREAVLSSLSAGNSEHAAESIKHSRWEILQFLFKDYLTGRTTVISDIQTGTNLAKATVRRCLGELRTMGIIGFRSDKNDRRRRVVFLTNPYPEIVDQFVRDCSTEFKDLIEIHDKHQREKSVVHTRAILENAFDAIITIDREGRIAGFNRSAERIFGYEASQAIGQQMANLIIPPALRGRHGEAFRRHIRKGKGTVPGMRFNTTAMAADGQNLDVELTMMSTKEDEADYFTAFIRDITERKRAEEALADAKMEAEIANRAKSEFLASMSHDLRTPLNAILGFAEMMKTKTFGPLGDPHYEEYASDIHQSGMLLLNLIDAILDLSKIESGKIELEETVIDMGTLLRSLVNMISIEAEARGIVLRMNAPLDLPCLLGDERAVTKIFDNLLSNALKFTPKGGTIRVAAKVLKNGSMLISLTDTGIGMSRGDIAKALKPFEQVDNSHSRKHEGTGLGLYICKRYVEMLGGILTVTSEVGKGTAVKVRFPPEHTIRPS